MTIGIQANILAIHDKLMDLLAKKATGDSVVGTNLVLQGAGPNSLGWNDRELDDFLEREVQAKFGVLIQRRHLRSTVNGTTPTVGDLHRHFRGDPPAIPPAAQSRRSLKGRTMFDPCVMAALARNRSTALEAIRES